MIRPLLLALSLVTALPLSAAETDGVSPIGCPCDCDGDGDVAIDELVTAVSVALSSRIEIPRCRLSRLKIHQLVRCVVASLEGCSAPATATPTPTHSGTLLPTQPPSTRPPNILMIIGDDHGWPDAGFMGHDFAFTPNLDQLAQQGTVFTNVHNTASFCRPSLLSYLAGVSFERWDDKHLALEAALGPIPERQEIVHYRTLPRELAKLGYVSWQAGKFWDGNFEQAGFSDGLAIELPHGFRLSNDGSDFGRKDWEQGTAIAPFTAFLDSVGESPFFAYITPMLPHAPFNPPPEFLESYPDLNPEGARAGYYANITWLDALIGNILAAIDQRGLTDDTIVIYASDNGWTPNDIFVVLAQTGRGKGTLYELGFRTPLIVSWPGVIAQGVRRDDLTSSLDVFPTILDYAGAPQLADRFGRSLRPTIESGVPVGRDKIVAAQLGRYDHATGHYVRTDRWRYIATADSREQLYEIAVDPFEETDLADQHPDLIEEFRADVEAWLINNRENPLECPQCER